MVTFVVASLQALVFGIILCPLAALYTCGLHISGGISLWRLIQHDYGNTDGDPSKANMNPALDVLYGLALVQGALFSYRIILLLACGKVVNAVAMAYGFQGDAVTSVSDYLVTTGKVLAKDPSLSLGRNLITYAVKLMESESPDDDRSGTRILDTIITYAVKNTVKDALLPSVADEYYHGTSRIPEYVLTSRRRLPPPGEEHKGDDMLMLIERLVGSPSSSNIFHKLLKALDSRSPHPDDIKIRESSARIVAHLAGNIRLNQFPRGIVCISSLFDSSGQHEHEVDGYKELVLQGLRIFGKLAGDQENCRVIGRANGLVSMIMRPVSSDLLHRVDHRAWSDIVDASLQVIYCLLKTAPRETATKLGDEVANNKAAIQTMRDIILDCKDCGEERHMLAMKILTELPSESTGNITRRLVSIFVDNSKDGRIRELAGEKLVTLSFQSQSIALLHEDCNLVDSLAALLLEDRVIKCRISAAGILEGLSSEYRDEECFQHLKNAITNVMPKVLRQILGLESTLLLSRNSVVLRGSNGQHYKDKELQVALLSLYVMAHEKLLSSSREQASEIHVLDDAFTLLGELEEMAEGNSDPKVPGCLRMLKLMSKMAISMMRRENGISQEQVRHMRRLIGTLGSAAESMLGLDGFVLFTGRDDGHTLASLVNEARGRLLSWC
uniref:Uncharacterized protein n=1 Tax=Avena sativa TaxID=4498 RepID=A0ACD6ADH4_AVESA